LMQRAAAANARIFLGFQLKLTLSIARTCCPPRGERGLYHQRF